MRPDTLTVALHSIMACSLQTFRNTQTLLHLAAASSSPEHRREVLAMLQSQQRLARTFEDVLAMIASEIAPQQEPVKQ